MNIRFSLLEIFVAELLAWLLLWLCSDYLATLLTFIVTSIVCAVLLFSLVAEALERSKVPRMYFQVMAVSILAPMLSALFYYLVFGGQMEWVE
jgi:hypothetical protein